jgi:hypothetical protein
MKEDILLFDQALALLQVLIDQGWSSTLPLLLLLSFTPPPFDEQDMPG